MTEHYFRTTQGDFKALWLPETNSWCLGVQGFGYLLGPETIFPSLDEAKASVS